MALLVASLGDGKINKAPWLGPKEGSDWGPRWQWWQLHMVVVVGGSDGGGERKGWDSCNV